MGTEQRYLQKLLRLADKQGYDCLPCSLGRFGFLPSVERGNCNVLKTMAYRISRYHLGRGNKREGE